MDFDFSRAKTPLAALEVARAAATALCSRAMRAGTDYLAKSGEFERKAREEAVIWSARAQSARDLQSGYRTQLKAAQKERDHLGRVIRLAQYREWLRGLWK